LEGNGSVSKNRVWLRLVILVAILAGLSFAFYQSGIVKYFLSKKHLLQFLQSMGPWDEVVFIVLQAAQVVLAPIPGEVTGLAGGYLYGPWRGIIWSTIGLTMGSFCAFLLARGLGRPVVDKFVPKSIVGRFDYLLHHKGAFVVFLLFLIPGFPKDALCWFLGLGHLTNTEFLLIGGTGRLFGTILLTLGGDFIRHHQYSEFFVLVGVALIVVLAAMAYRDKMERIFRFWHIRSYRRKRAKRPRTIS
jgi:uncharacterized membrane protein YdjX (TVP38/TMEM64 family)